MASVYRHIGGLNPRRSAFNNSYSVLFNCDMGQIIPIHCDEAIPGDHFTINNEAVVRFQPLTSPILHEVYLRTFWFFVPTRLIMNEFTMDELGDTGKWTDFITGGPDGLDTTTLPVWTPPAGGYGLHTLWDYFGFPLNVVPTEDSMPLAFPKRCYNLIYNEYFRDQNLIDEVSLDSDEVRNICWSKDRFTTALYDTIRGEPIAIPFEGLGSATWNNIQQIGGGQLGEAYVSHSNNGIGDIRFPQALGGINPPVNGIRDFLNSNLFDLSQAGGIDPEDFRRVMQLTKALERNMRTGARYTEQLRSRYGVYPQDHRLQRPEWIGASRSPIIISEVLNTTGTADRPQGDLAGHGITAQKTSIGRYSVKEHGYVVGLLCVQPVPLYNLGINKQWQRRTRWDFPTPELVNLSEVAVKNSELIVTGTTRDDEMFGRQGIYDEMRIKESRVCGDMRPGGTFAHWNLARDDYDIANPPSLNENFVTCKPSKRVFEVLAEPGLIVHVANLIRAVRPLPIIAQPGIVDHH